MGYSTWSIVNARLTGGPILSKPQKKTTKRNTFFGNSATRHFVVRLRFALRTVPASAWSMKTKQKTKTNKEHSAKHETEEPMRAAVCQFDTNQSVPGSRRRSTSTTRRRPSKCPPVHRRHVANYRHRFRFVSLSLSLSRLNLHDRLQSSLDSFLVSFFKKIPAPMLLPGGSPFYLHSFFFCNRIQGVIIGVTRGVTKGGNHRG